MHIHNTSTVSINNNTYIYDMLSIYYISNDNANQHFFFASFLLIDILWHKLENSTPRWSETGPGPGLDGSAGAQIKCHHPFWGDQTWCKLYGKNEGFLIIFALFVLVIWWSMKKKGPQIQHLPGERFDAFWRNVERWWISRWLAGTSFLMLDHLQAKFRGLRETLTSEEIEVRWSQWLDLCEVGEVFCNPDFSILYMAW